MTYARDANFIAMCSGLPEKPGRMEDAYVLYQTMRQVSGQDGDFVLVNPEPWLATMAAGLAKHADKKLLIMANFQDSEELKLSIGNAVRGFDRVRLASYREVVDDAPKMWAFAYLNDPVAAAVIALPLRERLAFGGAVIASEGSNVLVWPQVFSLKLPNHQTLYLMR